MTTPKDINDDLVEDLDATEEEAENVKGGGSPFKPHKVGTSAYGGIDASSGPA
jgi:hypothetical protein